MKQSVIEHETWLDLSHAAGYLGVHVTTLRRWADTGAVACVRTPGGRRRFSVRALDAFLARSSGEQAGCGEDHHRQPEPAAGDASASHPFLSSGASLQERAIDTARRSVREGIRDQGADVQFMTRIPEDQRAQLRGTGQQLIALLLQYNSRCDGGEAFLEEGRCLARVYSLICRNAGLSVKETAHLFLFFRRSIIDAVHETGYLGGRDDPDGHRLYSRSTDFLDQLLLDLIGSYMDEAI